MSLNNAVRVHRWILLLAGLVVIGQAVARFALTAN